MYRLPLASYRVLDLGPTAAAAYASRLLGDAGAEVIVVERQAAERSPAFRQLNRDKLGCTLDFATAQGAALLQRLVARCNVVIAGFDAAESERLGLTYNALQTARPDIIVASIRSAGASSPLDVVTGTAGAAAVCAALLRHRDSGEGQYVVVDARDCALSFQGVAAAPLPGRDEASPDARLRQRRLFEPVSGRSGIDEMPSLPWRLSLTPCHVRLPAPELGEHNRYVFRELLGMPEEEMAALERGEIIGTIST
jgi:crotonobetainyl-CoA:carnitine CoA-transferase CaiB-like acyl-CoA transferase